MKFYMLEELIFLRHFHLWIFDDHGQQNHYNIKFLEGVVREDGKHGFPK